MTQAMTSHLQSRWKNVDRNAAQSKTGPWLRSLRATQIAARRAPANTIQRHCFLIRVSVGQADSLPVIPNYTKTAENSARDYLEGGPRVRGWPPGQPV